VVTTPGDVPTRGARRAYVGLVLLSVLLSLASLFGSITYYQREQAAQQRQGIVFEHRLCTTLDGLAELQPPAGSPTDLSRAYLVRQHEVLAELGPDVGCR